MSPRFHSSIGQVPVNTAVVSSGRTTRPLSPQTGYRYLDAVLDQPGSVLAFAHRGGAHHPDVLGAENTLHAFKHAVALGYHYLETDVHATKDGVLVAFHDAVLDRMTDHSGALADLTTTDIAQARIGGVYELPTMASLFEEFPACRFNIDLKSPDAGEPLAALIKVMNAWDRVLVGSFSRTRLQEFRKLTGGRVPTSATPIDGVLYRGLPVPRLATILTGGRVAALQVPHYRGPINVITRGFVRRAHAAGVHVHVWTVDEAPEMHELLDLGVDGLFTDRTDVLKDVLVERGQWRDHA
ncbi:MAG: glycerophosphodiester phosphodiesterase [Marmoricola sp.]|jgi:glycerophosphoryl diester phosphodiesterase|nr:glycerophosphodiester phosphodiesterase [Marmoricola sp.]